MPKLTRIYTRSGDKGTTGLVGGARVKKHAPRIEGYGTIDELNSIVGMTRAELAQLLERTPRAAQLDRWLAWTQDALFNLGSELATLPEHRWENMPLIQASDAAALERAIDMAQADLQPLNNFIHPGGSRCGSLLHFARTVCRRAERLIVALYENEPISSDVLVYMNRLSDAFFVWARWINDGLGAAENPWNAHTQPPQ